MSETISKPIERILLIRLSALGDCLAAVPVFHALRANYPNAHIAWAIQDNFAPLIQTLPGLDEIVIFPRRRWRGMGFGLPQWAEARRFARHLRKRLFDVTVDVQSNTKSAGIAWLTRAPLRLGHGKVEAKEVSSWLNNRLVEPTTGMEHIVARNLHLLTSLGIEVGQPDFTLPPAPHAERCIGQWLRAQRVEEKRYTLLVPFSGNIIKEWPGDRYRELARRLGEQGKSVVFLNGPGKEAETAAMIPETSSGKVILGPKTDIPEMVELARRCGCAVGSDTGPIQIAGALGAATVSLFGPTDPRRSHPWGVGEALQLEATPEEVAGAVGRQWLTTVTSDK